MVSEGDVWNFVEARRDDGLTAMFRIRDLVPRLDQPRIFVVELSYPVTSLSRLPDAAAYRRVGQFEEQWLEPACAALGWTFVATKTEDGSFFHYLYGSDDPLPMIEKLSPFDGSLGFFDEQDPQWDEYAALRELLDQAHAMPPETPEPSFPGEVETTTPAAHKPAAKRSPTKKPPANKAAAHKAPANKAPASKAPANKAPAKRSPTNKTAANKAPASKAPAKRSPTNKTAANKTPANKAAANKAPAKRSPTNKTAANKAAANKAAANKAAANKAAANRAPAKKSAAKRAR